jgi:hypothetical protein
MDTNKNTVEVQNESMMTQIIDSLKNIQDTINLNKNETKEIKEHMKKIAISNSNIEEKVEAIKHGYDKLEKRINDIERRLKKDDREKREKNLLIFGLRKKTNETWRDLEKLVLIFFQEQMKIDIQIFEIDNIKRIHSDKLNERGLIIVTLTTRRRKIEILRSRKELRNTEISVEEDFPKNVVEKRKKLYPIMIEKRREGKFSIIKYDTLYVNGKVWKTEEQDNRSNKRKPEDSPKTYSGNENNNEKRKQKKKKCESNVTASSYRKGPMEYYVTEGIQLNQKENEPIDATYDTDPEEFNENDVPKNAKRDIHKDTTLQ